MQPRMVNAGKLVGEASVRRSMEPVMAFLLYVGRWMALQELRRRGGQMVGIVQECKVFEYKHRYNYIYYRL